MGLTGLRLFPQGVCLQALRVRWTQHRTFEVINMLKMAKRFLKGTSLTVLLGASATAYADTQWDLPLAWPAENYIVKSVSHFADQVSEKTNGEVLITLHPGGSLGFKGPEMFSAVRDGLVPIGDMLVNQQSGENPLLGLESLPYMIGSMEELKLFSKAYRPLLDEIYAKGNQKILFTIPWPQQQIFTHEKIETIDDLKGVKIRTYNKSSTEIFEAMDMTAVQLPWGEVVPALAAGAIDAVATSSPSAVDGAFWEFLGFSYPTRQTWNTNVVSVNLDYWNQLTGAERETIETLAADMEPLFWQAAVDEDSKQMETLATHGMVLGTIDDRLRDELKKRAAPLRNHAIEQLGPKASEVIEAFNGLR
jgi:TRAP-type C4-dicarboxylate transport system substrate-binding protein